jgi:hypothetical protein
MTPVREIVAAEIRKMKRVFKAASNGWLNIYFTLPPTGAEEQGKRPRQGGNGPSDG